MEINVKDIEVAEEKAQICCLLNSVWHSRLPKIHWSNVVRNTHYVCYVFTYDQAIIGTGIWSSPVAQNRFKNGKTVLELRRLALSNFCPKNTATYTISQMVKSIRKKFPDIKKLVSYQDNDVHLGTIYKASNWYIHGQSSLFDWNTSGRKRNEAQAKSVKTRWDYDL